MSRIRKVTSTFSKTILVLILLVVIIILVEPVKARAENVNCFIQIGGTCVDNSQDNSQVNIGGSPIKTNETGQSENNNNVNQKPHNNPVIGLLFNLAKIIGIIFACLFLFGFLSNDPAKNPIKRELE